jgi:primosomal protein N' (replication factor Y)
VTARVVRVLPDVAAIDKTFDYLVPDSFGDQVRVGTVVRIQLHGRRVGAWVVADGVEPPPGVALRPLAKVTGWGPCPSELALAEWAAWRWAGRRASLLGTATADHAVAGLPPAGRRSDPVPGPLDGLAVAAFDLGLAVLRLPPAADVFGVVLAAAARGDALVITPSVGVARHLGLRLRRAGLPIALLPRDWAAARAGGHVVIGARSAAWAPVPDLAAVVVLDEHDELHQEERTPTWHTRDVAVERAGRAGVPCVLVSPCPSLEALARCRLLTPSRTEEREGWPVLQIVDRRQEDLGRSGLWSDALVDALRRAERSVCILNRKGRSRFLACRTCGDVARCESCDAAVTQREDRALVCPRCGAVRPGVCLDCGALGFKNLRLGVTRAREELEALLGEPVVEVTGEPTAAGLLAARAYVGTEAALHHVQGATLVAFLDFDQELLAPRYRAGEEAMALLVRAARLVGGRRSGGRVLVQTRLPRHEVLLAALHADPGRWAEVEQARRAALGWPPFAALAEVSGAAGPEYLLRLGHPGALPEGVVVRGPLDGRYLVRAPDHRMLCDALAGVERPPGRLRVAVDPPRV